MTDAALHLFDMLTWRLARALPRTADFRARPPASGEALLAGLRQPPESSPSYELDSSPR